VIVSDITLAIELGDGDVKVVRRTTSRPVRGIKGQRPRVVTMSWRCSCYPDESRVSGKGQLVAVLQGRDDVRSARRLLGWSAKGAR